MIHRELKTYAQEDRRLTWRLLIGTCVAIVACATLVVTARSWCLAVAASVALGLARIRLAMFFHDYMHKAIFKGSRLGSALMKLVGFSMLVSPMLWLEYHQEHHWHTGKPDTTAVFGGFPVMTLDAWRNASARDRLRYRINRHPLFVALGYFTVFMFGLNVQPFLRAPRKRRGLSSVLAVHVAAMCVGVVAFGWLEALCLVVFPLVVAHGVLAYMFFAQHNFPGIDLRTGDEWSHDHAALRASSFFEMSPLMHWFTGNLGYHHVHHMNHRVPFYRLPEAMKAIPELQNPITTSWHPKEMLTCLRLAVCRDAARSTGRGSVFARHAVDARVGSELGHRDHRRRHERLLDDALRRSGGEVLHRRMRRQPDGALELDDDDTDRADERRSRRDVRLLGRVRKRRAEDADCGRRDHTAR
jgi:omega-6 fatty acid desaturase (delta-12 desaturase)